MAKLYLTPPDRDLLGDAAAEWLAALAAELERVLSRLDEENMSAAYNTNHPGVNAGGKEDQYEQQT